MTLGIRAEAWTLLGEEAGGIAVRIDLVEELGAGGYAYGTADLGGAGEAKVTVRLPARSRLGAGEVIRVRPLPGAIHLFDTATEQRIAG